ncbi:hypothetical protein MKW98_009716 [Papaver atlanticum]|uniref:Uncharacterized protein n=1 Tax=Papaver atlanticum TaxID=357466 RepID=A0AAD4XLX8_9MAGN|nr:hypothetical protein MKW98_009716 [Papaver atlanticum]
MAKTSMFLGFFLFVLIAMPTSSSSRMILEEVQEVVNKFPGVLKSRQLLPCPCVPEDCSPLECPIGTRPTRLHCCGCPVCYPV